MKSRSAVLLATFAASLAVGVGVALATQTFYVGTSTTYETLGVTPRSTPSTAQRIDNNVHCQFTTCHTDVWYTASGVGDFGLRHSNDAQDNRIDKSQIGSTWYFAYSKCSTTSGFGTNSARCYTDW